MVHAACGGVLFLAHWGVQWFWRYPAVCAG